MAAEAGATALPPAALRLGIPLAGILLVTFFVFLGFPYETLGDRITAELEQRTGVRVEFQAIGPGLQLRGPAIVATGLSARMEDGETLRLDRASLRPAWSLAWLRGEAAVFAVITKGEGTARGTVVLGEFGSWAGRFEQVDLDDVPLSRLASVNDVAGVVDADFDLAMSERGPEGRVTFEAAGGSLDLANFPLVIPYETLVGDLVFGDDAFVAVKRLQLTGPLANGGITGNVLSAPSFDRAPLRLELDVEAKPAVQAAMRGVGMRIDRSGRSKIRITGTVDRPNIR